MKTSLHRLFLPFMLLALLAWFLAACSPAAPAESPAAEMPAATEAPAAAEAPAAEGTAQAAPGTEEPFETPALTPPPSLVPTPEESRRVELEWPPRLRLGESDIIRLALVPTEAGYILTAEFPEHQVQSQTVRVPRPGGYDLFAVARLDGIGFRYSPEGDQVQWVPPGEAVAWRWSITPRDPGRQRLSVALALRWAPAQGTAGRTRETVIYSKGLDIRVASFLGLSRTQAAAGGVVGLILGGGLSLIALAWRPAPFSGVPGPGLQPRMPNPGLAIEPRPGLDLAPGERLLLQALFGRYARLVLEREFLSGYSGARTFLALPIRPDGRADAYTIAKLGSREAIRQEYENYGTFVKDTLPPVTARIQHPPVVADPGRVRAGRPHQGGLAAIQYTFIGAPGIIPDSLRDALLKNPDPALLDKLFDTFGPNWWMQRRPYTFRLAQEYDQVLPTHLVLEPVQGRGPVLGGRTPPSQAALQLGQIVTLRGFTRAELRRDGRSLSLSGEPASGQPGLRVRWLSPEYADGAVGRVVGNRELLLRESTVGCDLFGLPDPIDRLPGLLSEQVAGSQSAIHGDLNLENILVGPGGFVWLIDFARTREGHPLYDFAHLEAEIIAHILAARIAGPKAYLSFLDRDHDPAFADLQALRTRLHAVAGRCLFNPSQPREYELALYVACLGALKFANLDAHARHLLYLTAAHLVNGL
jgi:hypothetical protein